MQFLRTFGLLLMLAVSNAGIASNFENSLPNYQVDAVDFQFTEDLQNLSESILITPTQIETNRTFVSASIVPEYLWRSEKSRASRYLVYSRTIIPSLDVADIIFPFHYFL